MKRGVKRGVKRGSLRVIAGRAGGLRLASPPRARPTTDRVREAVFAALASDVVNASVLDLYAGSGALAIEALSRGARRAVLVERDASAADVCRRNLRTTHLTDLARVQHSSVSAFLRGDPPEEAPFDLVFSDPPYDAPAAEVEQVLERLTGQRWLAPAAKVVVERSVHNSASQERPSGLVVVWQREYGDTLISLLQLA